MALSIGVTGGIGSGKSMVCKIFKLLGVPVFEADTVAKSIINSDEEIRLGLIQLFGENIYTANKKVNRKMLAELIFKDDILLEKVNNLIHPKVRTEYKQWLQKQYTAYVVHEAAILFESGFYKMMDFNIFVSAPEEIRIDRVIKRDGVLPEMVKERIKKQWTDEEKRKLAGFELVNDNRHLLIPQIIEIDKKLNTNGKIW